MVFMGWWMGDFNVCSCEENIHYYDATENGFNAEI